LRIKRLKLTGFKSFVDPSELRIEPGLTGIVGPNGCGKSNLLEAIRWVMGEGSAKSLRGGAMDDVIFAGTERRPSRDFAEVSILAERDASQDDRELEVVRRIERGAGSAYRINGRDVRAKDVALLFADAATGAHSPALVSQGKISAVIAAKPVDRRAMLEEAAGISGLHVRRKDAEQKLRATETNLNRLNEVLSDMEQRAGTLRRQARAAERYRKLSTDIRIAEGRLIFARWRDAAAAALQRQPRPIMPSPSQPWVTSALLPSPRATRRMRQGTSSLPCAPNVRHWTGALRISRLRPNGWRQTVRAKANWPMTPPKHSPGSTRKPSRSMRVSNQPKPAGRS
jgi:chromosome segregation protein